ncbi:EamA family transporter [Streptomyces albidoflavus]
MCWACYILLNREVGRRVPGARGSAAAAAVSGLLYLPVGVVVLWRHPPTAGALGAALVAGVLSSAVRSWLTWSRCAVPSHHFGVWMSVNPVFAALIGWVVLGERMTGVAWVAVGVTWGPTWSWRWGVGVGVGSGGRAGEGLGPAGVGGPRSGPVVSGLLARWCPAPGPVLSGSWTGPRPRARGVRLSGRVPPNSQPGAVRPPGPAAARPGRGILAEACSRVWPGRGARCRVRWVGGSVGPGAAWAFAVVLGCGVLGLGCWVLGAGLGCWLWGDGAGLRRGGGWVVGGGLRWLGVCSLGGADVRVVCSFGAGKVGLGITRWAYPGGNSTPVGDRFCKSAGRGRPHRLRDSGATAVRCFGHPGLGGSGEGGEGGAAGETVRAARGLRTGSLSWNSASARA